MSREKDGQRKRRLKEEKKWDGKKMMIIIKQTKNEFLIFYFYNWFVYFDWYNKPNNYTLIFYFLRPSTFPAFRFIVFSFTSSFPSQLRPPLTHRWYHFLHSVYFLVKRWDFFFLSVSREIIINLVTSSKNYFVYY